MTSALQDMDYLAKDALHYLAADDSSHLALTPLWPRLGSARFLVDASIPTDVSRRLKTAFDLAITANQLHCTVDLIPAPLEMLTMARATTGVEIDAGDEIVMQSLLPWITSGHKIRPILELCGRGLLERRPALATTFGQCGLALSAGALAYLTAKQLIQFLKSPASTDELRERQCIIVQGLASTPDSWPELIPHIALEGGLGHLFVLVDEQEATWRRIPHYREMLLGAIEHHKLSLPTSEAHGSEELSIDHEVDRSSSDSDRELIAVVANIVARQFGVTANSLYERRSDAVTLKARQAAIYVARTWRNLDFQLIGKVLGERTGVSASQAHHRIQERCTAEPELAQKIENALSELRRYEHGLQSTR